MTIDERYANYLRWCMANDLPVLTPTEYEKALNRIPEQTVNNVDSILINSNKRKDKRDAPKS